MSPISDIKITYSPRRRKTISARLKKGVMYVAAPRGIHEAELQKTITRLKERLIKRQRGKELNTTHDLRAAAEKLNRQYFDGKLQIASIEYSSQQEHRYGSCNFRTGSIRISHRLASMPDWVRDFVIYHELAHLVVHGHGPRFHALESRYRLAERARGFLIAKGLEESEDPDTENSSGDLSE